MNCAVHPEAPATGYCRNCGKALCAQCAHSVHGMLYCEDCLARVVTTPPAPTASAVGSPALATLLGFIPGLGAVYNGEYTKAIVQVAIFAGLITAVNSSAFEGYQAFLGLAIACFYLYMPIDSYRVAKARQVGAQPLPIAASAQPPPAPAPAPAPASAPAMAPAPTQAGLHAVAGLPAAPGKPNWWVGPVILVVLGVLFLLGNFGLLEGDWLRIVGPLALIALGGWLLWCRLGRRRGAAG
jgi:B-box zinc finger